MSASETFAKDILQSEYDKRIEEFNRLSIDLNGLRSNMVEVTSNEAYQVMQTTKKKIEERRRELRGELSALRQAIVILGGLRSEG